MANQEEPIRIVIEEEDLPLIPDKPGLKAPDVKLALNRLAIRRQNWRKKRGTASRAAR
ncbi:MAG: hypothetical protein IPF56_12755 [Chloroflexi bacterium]|nr:hypothetical protein [Chloroflexota bacterium]